MVRTRRFEMLCAAMIGFGQLFLMVGYDSESFILESVIHSIHERDPLKISAYAGYYGQAILYAGYMLVCFISPSVISLAGPKRTLILAAICFSSFPVGFLFFNCYYYYFSSALLGAGLALYYQGTGGYSTSHSTRETIETNNSFGWSIGCCCFFVGSSIMAGIISWTSSGNPPESANDGAHAERRFSDAEITLLFSAFSLCSLLGVVNYILIPSDDVPNCIEPSKSKREGAWDPFKLTVSTLINPKMLQLIPLFALCGLNTSFWMAVFPTAMTFSVQNHQLIYIPAIYSLGLGLGEVLMALTISTLSKRIQNFGLKPTMSIGCVCVALYCALIQASTASEAPIRPTSRAPLLFQHSYLLIVLIAFICGVGDCCINSVRSVICALVMPERRAQAFSVSKIYQAMSSCVLFFLSPRTPLHVYTVGLPILALLATVLFFHIANSTHSMERKLTLQAFSENEKSESPDV